MVAGRVHRRCRSRVRGTDPPAERGVPCRRAARPRRRYGGRPDRSAGRGSRCRIGRGRRSDARRNSSSRKQRAGGPVWMRAVRGVVGLPRRQLRRGRRLPRVRAHPRPRTRHRRGRARARARWPVRLPVEPPAAASAEQRVGDRSHPRRAVLARRPVPDARRHDGGARARRAAPVRAPAVVAVRQRDGAPRTAGRAHGGADAPRRLPRQGEGIPRRARPSPACC